MSQVSLVNFAGGVVQASVAAQANSVVQRDSLGGATVNELTTNELNNTGATYMGQSTVTGSPTLDGTHSTYLCNAVGGAMSPVFPVASANAGMRIKLIKVDSGSNHVTATAAGGDTINGSSTGSAITSQYGYASYEATASYGWILS